MKVTLELLLYEIKSLTYTFVYICPKSFIMKIFSMETELPLDINILNFIPFFCT